ncbi:hypothetical protein [Fodinibius saliphilus]|uniref:hypothetical protein n=1 Tax=Fodinibius saliphilus TaxID=1920650 RepID=UPI0011085506|nr:hypothetical protein [Fodinibius saliphilus]
MFKKIIFLSTIFCIISIFNANEALAQNFGMSAGFGTSSSLYGDFFYLNDNSSFHFGGSYQFSDALGEKVEEREPNYGRTVIGNGSYFWSIDFGYNYHFENKIIVGGELSLGSQNEYTNYEDNRFSEGGYHMAESELTGGIGVNAGYEFSDSTFGFIGYNTLREITFGIRFAFLQ